jgi:uncharacterized protein (TIGR01777 family)
MMDTNKDRIVLAGGSGFLGALLTEYFEARGIEVIVLTRNGRSQATMQWDGATAGPWVECLNGARALVNLAGRSVNCRYNKRNRRLIMNSRVNSTRILGEAIARCSRPPAVWLNASTATIYKHSFSRPMDEANGEIASTPEAKDAFSVQVACEWEKTLAAAQTPNTRKIALRTAMVFGKTKGTVFDVLRRLVRLGLGGKMAGGNQFVSWLHEEDFCRSIEWLINDSELTGAVNICAPHPVPNREMMSAIRQVCGVPFGLPAARWMLELGAVFLRTETELIIKSRRVVPGRLLASGFSFHFPRLPEALQNLCARQSDAEPI